MTSEELKQDQDQERDQEIPQQEETSPENGKSETEQTPEGEGQAGSGTPEADGESQQEPAAQEDEDIKTRYLRLAADFQNFKRRTEKEKSDIYAYANEKFALDLLDVIDNFERALVHQQECKDEKMKEGMDMIFKQLQGVLEKNKIIEIPALGEAFDPNVHNAVMTEPAGEYESGMISVVLQKGYKLNNKVIRPAMVKVAE